jgi:hypothetical protein
MSIEKSEQYPLARRSDSLLFFHKDKANLLTTYQIEIARLNNIINILEKSNLHLESKLEEINKKKDAIPFLIKFRDMLSLHCIIKHGKLTILSCSSLIDKNECTFYDKCKPRKELLKSLSI